MIIIVSTPLSATFLIIFSRELISKIDFVSYFELINRISVNSIISSKYSFASSGVEIIDEYIKSIWIKVENSILKATNNDEKAILKVLGIIYMLNDLEIFSPEDEEIRLSLNLEIDRYEICINNLIDKKEYKHDV